ncbi:MAG: glycosyltransferase [Firmicutes bacterium]|nr:glycosyltransferase [Bacillota bacterium]
MLFSVLMSVYKNDKADEVAYAIDSVLNQTNRPAQIVLVIDGSVSDELHELILRYANNEKIVDVVPLEENVGLGKALSIGLMYCQYEYVARMDSDDYSLPDRFEKQVSFLEAHPEIAVLGGQIAEYDSTMKNELAVRLVPLSSDDIANKMRVRNGMNHVTVMYKKSAVLTAGNYQHCPYFEDYYLWCRMIKAGYKFHNLDSVLVNVRTGEGMYQRRGGKAYNEAITGFQKKILELGVVNHFQYLLNLAIRLCLANMPNSLRGYLYKTKLRSKSKG